MHPQEHLLYDVLDLGVVRHAPHDKGPEAAVHLKPHVRHVLHHVWPSVAEQHVGAQQEASFSDVVTGNCSSTVITSQ